jgi:hypothetical protein
MALYDYNGYLVDGDTGQYVPDGNGGALTVEDYEAQVALAEMAGPGAQVFADAGAWGGGEEQLTEEQREIYYDRAVADYIASDPAAADIDPDLFSPFVSAAESWEEARDLYHQFGAAQRGEQWNPPGEEAPPAPAAESEAGDNPNRLYYGGDGRVVPDSAVARFEADGVTETPSSRLDAEIDDLFINGWIDR